MLALRVATFLVTVGLGSTRPPRRIKVHPVRSRGLVLCLAMGLLGCGGGAVVRARTNVAPERRPDAPLSIAANRNALPPEPISEDEELGRLVLWCSQPAGVACLAAQQELGQLPTPAQSVPGRLLTGGRDLEDDCSDPDLAPLLDRVGRAVGITPGRWVDQEGQIRQPDAVADLYSGSGCTNVATAAEPPVKVHLVPLEGFPHYLVRVWEVGEAQ